MTAPAAAGTFPPDAAPSARTRARPHARPRRAVLRDMLIVAASVVVIAGLVKLVWRQFTFFGDNAESFLPLWHMYGQAIRNGTPFLFTASGWGGGNVIGEAAYGVLNPVTVVNAIGLSFTDHIAAGGFVIMTEFLVILGIGVYLLARSYGATSAAAVMAGAIAPFAGYTLFYEAGNWASGLMAVAWVVHFWWAARMFATDRVGPLAPLIFGYLAITVGSPYSVVGVVVVLGALAVERLIARDARHILRLVVVGGVIGLFVIMTYIALVAVLGQIDRPVGGAPVSNSNYLTPSLGDMLALSAPTYLPRFAAWYSTHDLVPSAYLSWILVPLLPWIRWRQIDGWRRIAGLPVAAVVFGVLTLGPDHLWLFRWPLRFIEYTYIAVLVLVAVLLSRGLGRTHRRARAVVSAAAVAAGLFSSWASTPERLPLHLLATVVVVVGVVAALWLGQRVGLGALAAVAIAGTAVMAPLQGGAFAWSGQHVAKGVDQTPPPELATVRKAWSGIHGRILQVAELERLDGTDAVARGELVFGDTGAAAGLDILNRYTGINFLKFKDGMAFDYRGTVGDWFPLSALFSPVSAHDHTAVADALGLDVIVVYAHRRDVGELPRIAHGWHVTQRDDIRIVLERDRPISHPALHSPDGVAVTDARTERENLTFDVATTSGGTVIADRLAWNGYRASIDGRPLPVTTTTYGLLGIRIPAGAHGTVHVDYTIPGFAPSVAVAAAGAAGVVFWQILWWTRRRRKRAAATTA